MSNSSDGKTFNTDVTADPSNFEAAMKRTAKSAVDATDQINAQFKKIGDTFSTVTKYFAGFTAVLAGGGALKKFVDDANEWNGQAGKMAKQLGITTERASVLNVALKHLGVDADVYTSASEKLSKQVQGNAQAFEVMGVKVRDSTGAYRPVTQVMGEVNEKLAAIKNPIEQNIAGQQIYGKGWSEVRQILKLTSEQMDHAEVRARELGLVVGPQGVAMSKQYSEQMRDLGLVFKSLEIQLGNALLPVFTKTGSFLAQAGPAAAGVFREVLVSVGSVISTVYDTTSSFVKFVWSGFTQLGQLFVDVFGVQSIGAMDVFRNVLKLVELAAVGLATAFKLAGEAIHATLDWLVGQLLRFGDAGLKALKFDFNGAKEAWRSGGQIIEQAAAEHQQRMYEIARSGGEKMNDIIMRPAAGSAAPGTPDAPDLSKGPQYRFKEKPLSVATVAEQSRMSDWEASLAQQKAAYEREGMLQGQYREISKERELKYWQTIRGYKDLNAQERLSIDRKAADVEMSMIKETFEVKVATLQAEAAQFKNNTDERLRIEREIQAKYAVGTKQFEESQKRINEIQRQALDQDRAFIQSRVEAERDAQLQLIALEEQSVQQQQQLGLVTQAQVLAQQEQFEQRRYAIAFEALRQRLEDAGKDPDRNPAEMEKIHRQLEQLEQQHQLRLGQIKGSLKADDMKGWVTTFSTIEQGIAQIGTTMLTKWRNVGAQLKSVLSGIGMTMITELVTKPLAAKAIAWIRERAMNLAGIGADAAKAGSGAASSVASVPYIGPMLAAAAMASTFAAVSAMASNVPSFSAAGGFDIPGSINPVVQAHAKEMVLPAKVSDWIRDATGEGEGGSGGDNYSIALHALDPRSFKQWLRDGGGAVLVDHLRKARRNFEG